MPKIKNNLLTVAIFYYAFDNLHKVTGVMIDMWKAFLFAVRKCCPRAKIVIHTGDKVKGNHFHVMKQAKKILDNCRRRLQREKKLKGSIQSISKLLFLPQDELKPEDKETLKAVFTEVPKLRKAYRLYHFLRCWYNTENLGKARRLRFYRMYQVKMSGVPEFLKLTKTIRKWRNAILNYFRAFLTNGPVKGTINKIKLIKCITYNGPHNSPKSCQRTLFFSGVRF